MYCGEISEQVVTFMTFAAEPTLSRHGGRLPSV
jgi:hypothetical protein